MSAPFSKLCSERAANPEQATREAVAKLQRWANLSGSKLVPLEEVAWFGAVFMLAGVYSNPGDVTVEADGNVTKIVAGDGMLGLKDEVSL